MAGREADAAAFLHQVAHDLRAPLAAVRTMIALLSGGHLGALQPAQGEMVGRIAWRLSCLQCLLDDLLDLAALRSSPPAAHALADACAAAAEACQRQGARAPREAPRLGLDVPGLPVHAAIPRPDLDLVLDHLLSNALKYGRGGEVTVRVSQEAGHARLRVADKGIGIAAEALPRLFEPLYRSPAAVAAAPGSGLGLLIVREAVERCGGTVAVTSTEGEGAVVVVDLPAAPPAAAAACEESG